MDRETISKDYLVELFEELNKKDINYIVLRGFLPLIEIEKSVDIDVYVNPRDKRKLNTCLTNLGWEKKVINIGRYPHVFFMKYDEEINREVIIDVVFGIYYGQELYKFVDYRQLLNSNRKIDVVKVPESTSALLLFFLHVLFDKNSISQENLTRLNLMYEDYKKHHNTETALSKSLAAVIVPYVQILIDKGIEFDEFKSFKDKVLKMGWLDYNIKRRFVMNGITKCNLVIFKIFKIIGGFSNVLSNKR